MNLTIDISTVNDVVKLKVTGEVDVYTVEKLKDQLIPLTEEKGQIIEVDLENTTYLDSTGLGVFINAYKSSEEYESTLKLVHVKDRILRLFTVTGLQKIMEISTDEEQGESNHG